MPELGDVSASSSFDALLASDDSTVSEVESESKRKLLFWGSCGD
jgi:hypothetical protein